MYLILLSNTFIRFLSLLLFYKSFQSLNIFDGGIHTYLSDHSETLDTIGLRFYEGNAAL